MNFRCNHNTFCNFLLVLRVLASLKHRSVMHYGYRFDYAANAVDRTPLPRVIPVKCLNLMERLVQQNVISHLPDQLTINLYQPGQGKQKPLQLTFQDSFHMLDCYLL